MKWDSVSRAEDLTVESSAPKELQESQCHPRIPLACSMERGKEPSKPLPLLCLPEEKEVLEPEDKAEEEPLPDD